MSALALNEARAAGAPPFEDFEIPVPGGFRADSGEPLADTHIRLRRYGRADGPPVLVMGGISAGRTVCGDDGWWREIAGPGAALDTQSNAIYGFDFAPVRDQRIALTPHAQARLIAHALDALGVAALHAVIGASYGGLVGLALAAHAPARVGRLCIISAAHRPAPLAQAWRGVQRRIVEAALEQGRASEGLALARQLAMITYRTEAEFDQRFTRALDETGRSDLDRYLIARGGAYGEAMAPQRWLSLSESLDRAEIAPNAVTAPTTLIACREDQLVPVALMEELAQALPRLSALHVFSSLYGHDAFLKETARISHHITTFLEGPAHV